MKINRSINVKTMIMWVARILVMAALQVCEDKREKDI